MSTLLSEIEAHASLRKLDVVDKYTHAPEKLGIIAYVEAYTELYARAMHESFEITPIMTMAYMSKIGIPVSSVSGINRKNFVLKFKTEHIKELRNYVDKELQSIPNRVFNIVRSNIGLDTKSIVTTNTIYELIHDYIDKYSKNYVVEEKFYKRDRNTPNSDRIEMLRMGVMNELMENERYLYKEWVALQTRTLPLEWIRRLGTTLDGIYILVMLHFASSCSIYDIVSTLRNNGASYCHNLYKENGERTHVHPTTYKKLALVATKMSPADALVVDSIHPELLETEQDDIYTPLIHTLLCARVSVDEVSIKNL